MSLRIFMPWRKDKCTQAIDIWGVYAIIKLKKCIHHRVEERRCRGFSAECYTRLLLYGEDIGSGTVVHVYQLEGGGKVQIGYRLGEGGILRVACVREVVV